MQKKLTLLFLLLASFAYAQKKPLDHTVYDSWEAVGAKQLSNNGFWASYAVLPQEGDANLYFQQTQTAQKIKVARASNAVFSADSKFAAFSIKPFFKDTCFCV
eukprot:GDKJ01035779.1.p1 GENE.GDKJ01035779.1~~GDKJ01035779.1.p1  ORF type:complete len:103 (+),score=6.78 GDKJ01035779.1:137-445(+)